MHDFDPIVSPYNGYMLRNLSKYYLFICCKQSSSTHICRFLTTASVTDVLAGSNPMRWAQKRKAPIAGSLSNRWWAMRDVACGFAARFRFGPAALACCAGKRLRVSSAPHPCGFESLCDGPEKGKAPIAGSLSNRWWAMRDVRVRLAPPALASGLRPSRAALENASRFLSSAPCRVRIPLRWAHTKTVPFRGPFPIRWWAMRDSNPQPCACKAPALTVAPIARRD